MTTADATTVDFIFTSVRIRVLDRVRIRVVVRDRARFRVRVRVSRSHIRRSQSMPFHDSRDVALNQKQLYPFFSTEY